VKIGFVIPARLASQRLKNKILLDLNGKTVLDRVIERAQRVQGVDEVVIAIANEPENNIITKICSAKNIRYFIGDPIDVFKRIKETSDFFGYDYIATITPDNPLFSTHIVNLMIKEIYNDPNIDYIKIDQDSVPIGSWPYILNVKLLRTLSEFKSIINTEIWGVLIKEDFFKVKTLSFKNVYNSKFRLTLDTYEDYLVINKIYAEILKDKNFVTLDDAIFFLETHPEIAEINSHVVQKSVNLEIIKQINEMYAKNADLLKEIKRKYY